MLCPTTSDQEAASIFRWGSRLPIFDLLFPARLNAGVLFLVATLYAPGPGTSEKAAHGAWEELRSR